LHERTLKGRGEYMGGWMSRREEEDPLGLMAILAHPDDESLGCGGVLARYAEEGVATHVLTATRGDAGRHGEGPHPGREAVGRIREEELRSAARELGVRSVEVLGYPDGGLDQADPEEVQGLMVEHIRRARPHVVLTFGPDGAYGHPDHIAVSQLALGAVMKAADGTFPSQRNGDGAKLPPHRVSKLYFMAWTAEAWEIYQSAFKTLTSTVDGVVRKATPWPEWAVTTRVDCRGIWRRVWKAVLCHETQMSIYGALKSLSEDTHRTLWGNQTYYRVFSSVNGGREVEEDFFAGLRVPETMEAIG
jgi:LmbE family N-acetylglucosaminyl deacetylase